MSSSGNARAGVDWVPNNLTSLWPVETLPKRIPPAHKRRTTIAAADDALFRLTVALARKVLQYDIPNRYRIAVAIITSKIRWLQLACDLRPLTASSIAAQRACFNNIHDGFRRNLEFSFNVLDAFLDEIIAVDESPTLEAWLYTEYFSLSHHPPAYLEYKTMEVAILYPLSISVARELAPFFCYLLDCTNK
jgi:hypothetical protein